MTIIYEFPSEDADIGPFVSNEILHLKYTLCPLNLVFLHFVFGLDMVCLIGMLCNIWIIL